MKVLVVGCNGQVGRALLERMPEEVELLAVDRQTLNITEASNVEGVISEFKPQFVINAAGYTNVDQAELERELCYAVNCDGARNLALSSHNVDATLIHLSTDYVFAGDKAGQYAETDLAEPLNAYGLSKLAGEEAVREANTKHIIVRTSWVFGEHGNNFVKTMLRLGKKHETLSVVEDQYGGPTYAGDIAQAIITIMEKLSANDETVLYGTYHFSGQPHVSWYDFAAEIFHKAEANSLLKAPILSSITTEMYPTLAARPKNSTMNCQKVASAFNVKPSNWLAALESIEGYMES
ncbi:dTDP-4-dehydrorhamnose reductase [Vibrio breoganii]|uniref:dTDP-4-dehydrorhamnose reductase n=1 Tax=Vibrio breoganii TaxID=553239 RepID=UPI000C868262|nr:dTDP-4-dehydrorhamnose reductase [Vibrio breoganii]PMO94266.1 dTDP-4-dehydrorhamnose reductase [Vibrio breoganii]